MTNWPTIIPAEFADMAMTHSNGALSRQFGKATSTIAKWRRALDLPPASALMETEMPMPDNFKEIAQGKTQHEIAEVFGCKRATARRWWKEAGFVQLRRTVARALPIPDWWTKDAPNLNQRQAAERAGVSEFTIRRWERRTGVECERHSRKAMPRVSFKRRSHAPQQSARLCNLADRAANEVLRKLGPVSRCKPDGTFDVAGSHWHRGGKVRTDEEIICAAVRNGFQAQGARF